MRSKVIFEDANYSVNETLKTITCNVLCKVDLTKFDFWRFMNKINASEYDETVHGTLFACNKINKYLDKYNAVDGTIYFTTSATATCGDNDTFDEEIGKHIALTRAQENAFRDAAVMYHELANAIYMGLITDIEIVEYGCTENAYNTYLHDVKLSAKPDAVVSDIDTYVENKLKSIYA